MQYQGTVHVSDCFGVPEAPCLVTVPMRQALFSVTQIIRPLYAEMTSEVSLPASDAYFLMLYLNDTRHCDIFSDGTRSPVRRYRRGTICLVDLREGAAIALEDSLYSLAFVLPRLLFDELAELSAVPAGGRLRCTRGADDPVLANLGVAILPLFASQRFTPPALLQHLATAVCAHLLHDYSDDARPDAAEEMELSEAQETAAKALMVSNLASDLSTAAIASVIGMSETGFMREFRRATGSFPQEWLERTRLSRAKEMLRDKAVSIQDIAACCGFADEVTFRRVFAETTGMEPEAWRASAFH